MSEGLGRETAKLMSHAGLELILTARSDDRLKTLSESLPAPSAIVTCDIASRASVEQAFLQVGDIDGVVFFAGTYEPIAAQEWDAEAVERMCDVNFTGCARVLGASVPRLVSQGRGHIVLIGSLAGIRGQW